MKPSSPTGASTIAHRGDQGGRARAGQAGGHTQHGGGQPLPAQDGQQRPRGQRGEERLAVAHRLHQAVRQDRPQPGQQDPGTAVLQVRAEGVQAGRGGQAGGPRDQQLGGADVDRQQELDQRHQARVHREEGQVGEPGGAVCAQRDGLVVAVLGDARVPDGVVAGEQLPQREVPGVRRRVHREGQQGGGAQGGVQQDGGKHPGHEAGRGGLRLLDRPRGLDRLDDLGRVRATRGRNAARLGPGCRDW
jgi:hypothetical protein